MKLRGWWIVKSHSAIGLLRIKFLCGVSLAKFHVLLTVSREAWMCNSTLGRISPIIEDVEMTEEPRCLLALPQVRF